VPTLLGLAFLTRPDSGIYMGPLVAFVAHSLLRRCGTKRAFVVMLASLAIYLVVVVLQTAFRLNYYGEWLPNTYTLKMGSMPLGVRIENGVSFITPFLIQVSPVVLVALIALVPRLDGRRVLLLTLFASAVAYQIWVGGDPWEYWRIPAPTLPLLIVVFTSGALALSRRLVSLLPDSAVGRWHETRLTALFCLLLSAGAALSLNWYFRQEVTLSTVPYTTRQNGININIAVALDELTTSDATIGVFWAGSIPYYLDRRAIDFLGKSDRYIARLDPDLSGMVSWLGMSSVPGHNKYDLRYSIGTLEPTFVQDLSYYARGLSRDRVARYVLVEYRGVALRMLRDSPAVLWDRPERVRDLLPGGRFPPN
jgi:hypothetical protein